MQVGKGASAAAPARAARGAVQIDELDGLAPEQYQKKSKALPKEVGTEGAPPPKDDKPAGGKATSRKIG